MTAAPLPPVPATVREAGFTLIELVVTAAIIVLLGGAMVSLFGVSRAFPPSRAAVSTAQTLSEAVWAFQREHDGRVPASSAQSSEWQWRSGPVDREGKPYTGKGSLNEFRSASVRVCFDQVNAARTPPAPTDAACGPGAGPASDVLALVVYTPRTGAVATSIDGYTIDVYARQKGSDAFAPSHRKCGIERSSMQTTADRDTC